MELLGAPLFASIAWTAWSISVLSAGGNKSGWFAFGVGVGFDCPTLTVADKRNDMITIGPQCIAIRFINDLKTSQERRRVRTSW
jgi:hypothetical protein